MSIIRELHTRLSRPTWRETAKADKWSRPLAPIVGVGFIEEIRTIISDATRGPFQPPSKVLVFVNTILSPEPGVGHEATRISRCARRCVGVAARGGGQTSAKIPRIGLLWHA